MKLNLNIDLLIFNSDFKIKGLFSCKNNVKIGVILILRTRVALVLSSIALLGLTGTVTIGYAKPDILGAASYTDNSRYTKVYSVLETKQSDTVFNKSDYKLGIGNGFKFEDGKYVNMEELSGVNKSGKSSIVQVIDIDINENQEVRVGITEDYISNNYKVLENTKETSEIKSSVYSTSSDDIDVKSILTARTAAKQEIEREEEQAAIEAARQKRRDEANAKTYTLTQEQGGLLDITNPDPDYTGKSIKLSADERWILERIVMGEAGNQGVEGAALVAQCLRDTLLLEDTDKVSEIRIKYGYTGSLKWTPNQDVIDAVAFIFDQGGYCVKHRIMFFYAPKLCKSNWHESQDNIINYKDHKFFDRTF